MLHVRDVMHSPVETITPETNLPAIKRTMHERAIRHLPVIEHGRVVGIVTLGDLRQAQPSGATTLSKHELQYALEQLTARTIMRQAVITVPACAPVATAAQLMLTNKLSSLVVLDEQRLVGMITARDLLAAVPAATPYELTATVTTPGSPRRGQRRPIV